MANLDEMIDRLKVADKLCDGILEKQEKILANLDVLQTRVAEQRDAPVHAEQNGAVYCTSHVAPVVNGYCFECGLPRLPHSNRSAGG